MVVDRVLFLDVDGVLNRIEPETDAFLTMPAPGMEPPYWVELNVVATLNAVLAQCPRARIVVSSTWRMSLSTPALFTQHTRVDPALLHEDWRTPSTEDGADPDSRPGEIADWLSRHPEVDRWVAVDDTLYSIPAAHFVPVDAEFGLTYPMLQEALRILGYTLGPAHVVEPERAKRVTARRGTARRT